MNVLDDDFAKVVGVVDCGLLLTRYVLFFSLALPLSVACSDSLPHWIFRMLRRRAATFCNSASNSLMSMSSRSLVRTDRSSPASSSSVNIDSRSPPSGSLSSEDEGFSSSSSESSPPASAPRSSPSRTLAESSDSSSSPSADGPLKLAP